jgi:glycosyltransferase involved in cell wall biosynthesis
VVLTDRDWTHPEGGGTGTNLFGQVSRWLAWGHRVTIIAASYPGALAREEIDGLSVYRMGGRCTVFPRAIWRQWRGLVPDADVVLEVVNGITFLTPLWLRTPRVALVHHIHRDHYVEELGVKGRIACLALETAPLRLLYGGVRFIAISESAATGIANHGVPRSQILVTYCGVELDAFGTGARARDPMLLYLGRLKRYKHVERLLDIVAAIPGATLHVAGDGDHRPELEREIAGRGLSDRVRLHGYVDEAVKVQLLQMAWVNLVASAVEGWCLSVMEAAACGTPSVALANGGLPESIDHGRTGLLAADASGLVDQARILVGDPALRERLGAAALERAREFTWDRTAARTLAILAAEARPSTRPLQPALASAVAHSEDGA